MNHFAYCKLEIFIPKENLPALQEALRRTGAGHIGDYDSCLSYSEVVGCWRPLAGSMPYLGEQDVVHSAPELKVEVICPRDSVDRTVDAIHQVHPYEVPVIHVIPLYRTSF